jgi:hypothetical protein
MVYVRLVRSKDILKITLNHLLKIDYLKCSRTCDFGLKTREVKCIDGNNEPCTDCDELTKPNTREPCNLRDCPQGEQPLEYKGIIIY